MRPAEPEVWNLRLSSSSSLSLSVSLSFPAFHLSAHCCSCQPTMGAEKGQTTFKKKKKKGFLKRAPWKRQPRPFISLIPPNNTGACHCLPFFSQHATQPVIISSIPLSFSFSSLSLSHVLKAIVPLLTFLSSLQSFLLSACHLLFHLLFPVFLPLHFYFMHSVKCPGCFFFFLFSLCVLCLFTQPSFLLLLSSSVLYRSLGSLSIGTSADASQRQPNKQFCRYA